MRNSAVLLVCPLLIGLGVNQAQAAGGNVAPNLDHAGVATRLEMPAQTGPNWGVSNPHCYMIPGFVFIPFGDTESVQLDGPYIYWSGGTDVPLWRQTFYLRSGAEIYATTTFFYDTDDVAGVSVAFHRYAGAPDGSWSSQDLFSESSVGSSGYQGTFTVWPTSETVWNHGDDGKYNLYEVYMTMQHDHATQRGPWPPEVRRRRHLVQPPDQSSTCYGHISGRSDEPLGLPVCGGSGSFGDHPGPTGRLLPPLGPGHPGPVGDLPGPRSRAQLVGLTSGCKVVVR